MLHKILIIRFSSIGDIVLTTPVVRTLHEQFEGGCEIHYLTKSSYASILEHNPYITKTWTIEKSTNEVMDGLQEEGFTYVFDLHHNLRTARVKKKLKALSFSFPKLNVEKWLLVNLKINRMPDIHIVERYMETVKPFGITDDGKGLDYFIGPNDHVSLDEHKIPARFVVFAIGGSYNTKKMPLDKMIRIADRLESPLVLCGGKEDLEAANAITQKAKGTIINMVGKLSINQSASLVSQSATVLTHDTGMMHIAAAYQKKIVSVWGNTVPELGMTPFLQHAADNHILEVKDLKCRPCSKLGHGSCPKKHFKCMEDIPDDKIIACTELK